MSNASETPGRSCRVEHSYEGSKYVENITESITHVMREEEMRCFGNLEVGRILPTKRKKEDLLKRWL